MTNNNNEKIQALYNHIIAECEKEGLTCKEFNTLAHMMIKLSIQSEKKAIDKSKFSSIVDTP